MAKCESCGKPTEFMMNLCPECIEKSQQENIRRESDRQALVAHSQSATTSVSPIVNRYRDAYRVGTALIGLGNATKIVGGILSGIIFLGSLGSSGDRFGGSGVVLAGIFIAVIVGGLFWVCGVIVTAQGQILRATLDNAVANSPFLTDHERLDAMGLPRSVANRASVT